MASTGNKSSNKKKATATEHAQNRAQREQGLPEAPPMPRSHRKVDQDADSGETTMQRETWPQAARRNTKNQADDWEGRTPVNEGERSLRRGGGKPDGGK